MNKAPKRPHYENWPRQKAGVSELFLDPENIRLQIEVESPQNSLINDLFLNEKAMQVLESILHNGFFPDEVPVAIKENGKLVVIDGNRRVAALKVMARPQLVPSMEAVVKDILKDAGPVIKQIEVVVAPDRNSVQHLLASKHTQNTRRPWRPLRQAYFYKAELARGKTVQDLRNEYPVVDIERFLRYINVHRIARSLRYDSDHISKKVHNDRTFPVTTIERLYEDKQVREFLGFDFHKDGEAKIRVEKKEFEKGFKKIVQDVVSRFASGFGPVDSRTLNSEKQRSSYLSSFPANNIPKKGKGSKITTSKNFREIVLSSGKKRRKLAPMGIEFGLQSAGVRRMLSELQAIDYHKFPNASHDLMRSFLECSLKAYFEETGKEIGPRRGQYVTLDRVLRKFLAEMKGDKNQTLAQVTERILAGC